CWTRYLSSTCTSITAAPTSTVPRSGSGTSSGAWAIGWTSPGAFSHWSRSTRPTVPSGSCGNSPTASAARDCQPSAEHSPLANKEPMPSSDTTTPCSVSATTRGRTTASARPCWRPQSAANSTSIDSSATSPTARSCPRSGPTTLGGGTSTVRSAPRPLCSPTARRPISGCSRAPQPTKRWTFSTSSSEPPDCAPISTRSSAPARN
ncbi:MAG: hypothetical protein AVDCRST_MAG59-4759, partial [uncultured Thermomicrobiales bacterium]